MEEKEQHTYYVPHITDIRVGYMCEYLQSSSVDGDGNMIQEWESWIVGEKEDDAANFITFRDLIEREAIRSEYISIHNIVRSGWTCEGKIEPPPTDPVKDTVLYKFTKDGYGLIYDFIAKVVMIYIAVGDIFSVCVQRFDCPSMNELLYIESHLNLHKP